MARCADYKTYIDKCECSKIAIKHITVEPSTNTYKIKKYDTLCKAELPVIGRVVNLSSLQPDTSALVITERYDTLYIYDFLSTSIVSPSTINYILFLSTATCGSPPPLETVTLSAGKAPNFIVSAAGGNGYAGFPGQDGGSSTMDSTGTIGIGGFRGAGGGGGAGGGSFILQESFPAINTPSTFTFKIGYNCADLQDPTYKQTNFSYRGRSFILSGGPDGTVPGYDGGLGGNGQVAFVTSTGILQSESPGSVGGGNFGGNGGQTAAGSQINGGGGGGGGGRGIGQATRIFANASTGGCSRYNKCIYHTTNPRGRRKWRSLFSGSKWTRWPRWPSRCRWNQWSIRRRW